MEQWLDGAGPPRQGEELDTEKLAAWLAAHVEGAGGELEIEQFPSGYSNLTYLLRMGESELVLRRPPFGSRVRGAHDMGREYRVLSSLHPIFPAAPRAVAYCDDEEVLGAPFYVMERRRGIVLRRQLPPGFDLPPILARRLSESFIDQLAELHSLDFAAAGLGDLDRGDGYVRRQLEGWTRRYEKSQTDSWPELDLVAAWLHETQPEDAPHTLVHNDYKYDNLVLSPHDLTRIDAVLDWEMCTVGDPLMDLGSSLAYWTEAGDGKEFRALGFGPTDVPGSLTRLQLAERYAGRTGYDGSHLVFYFCFGLFKLAVIAQQIYYRFFKGLTQDERFAGMNLMVGMLGRFAARTVEKGCV